MKPKIIIILLFALLIVIFSLQNAEIVQVKLLFWEMTFPRVLLILVSVSLGIIIGMFISGSKKFKNQDKEDKSNSN